MTIHASKGLEFPIVISVAGFKQRYTQDSGPFLYHDKNEIKLGFGNIAKKRRAQEELEEWKRLFYVDFTRASSILILPRYAKWKSTKGVKKEFQFLESSIRNLVDSKSSYTTTLQTIDEWNPKQLSKDVRTNILKPLNALSGIGKTLSPDEISDNILQQRSCMSNLQKNSPMQASCNILTVRSPGKQIRSLIRTMETDSTLTVPILQQHVRQQSRFVISIQPQSIVPLQPTHHLITKRT
jgi:exodeoxyribonuclease V beta subunit